MSEFEFPIRELQEEAALEDSSSREGAATRALRSLPVSSATEDAYLQLVEGFGRATAQRLPGPQTLDLVPGGDLAGLGLVVGVGLGVSLSTSDLTNAPGLLSVHLYTAEPVPQDVAIQFAASAFDATALSSDEASVQAIHTGQIDLQAHRFRLRPAPGGISVGHHRITAGTLGCLCRGRRSPRDTRLLVLSNNHVLANVNQGSTGDAIVQPGVADGGTTSQDQIGVLERFVTISFPGPNFVDCATAWVDELDVRRDLVFLRGNVPNFFRVSATTVPATVGMTVGKSGRTTQLTAGRVIAVGATIQVNMGGGRVAQFVDQFAVQGVSGDFSRGGDSGSLVWTWDVERNPVGLLFAGGLTTTFANPIDRVLTALDVDLVV